MASVPVHLGSKSLALSMGQASHGECYRIRFISLWLWRVHCDVCHHLTTRDRHSFRGGGGGGGETDEETVTVREDNGQIEKISERLRKTGEGDVKESKMRYETRELQRQVREI